MILLIHSGAWGYDAEEDPLAELCSPFASLEEASSWIGLRDADGTVFKYRDAPAHVWAAAIQQEVLTAWQLSECTCADAFACHESCAVGDAGWLELDTDSWITRSTPEECDPDCHDLAEYSIRMSYTGGGGRLGFPL